MKALKSRHRWEHAGRRFEWRYTSNALLAILMAGDSGVPLRPQILVCVDGRDWKTFDVDAEYDDVPTVERRVTAAWEREGYLSAG
ncbi:MAG TPA: hypothetical protein VKA84_10260 [Gemmatimonadaceae bacterium]|nr:hypothetical protein [Gemmatimonadaceae bacterium]